MGNYKYPEVLVSTDWVAAHIGDPKVRLVEVDVDTTAYEKGHIENAVGWNWTTQLQDNVRRNLLEGRNLSNCSASQASLLIPPWCSTVTTTTGLLLTPSGSSSISATKTPA